MRAFAQETVLLNIRSAQYYGIDSIGGRFLAAIREAPTLAAASKVLADEYAQPLDQVQRDLAAFVDQLLDRGLIEIVPAA
jgi:hypothetical protein